MKGLKKLKRITTLKRIIKFIILNVLILVSILVCMYYYFITKHSESKKDMLNGDSWYETIDQSYGFDYKFFSSLSEISRNIQDVLAKYSDIPVYTDEAGNKYITYESFGTNSKEGFDNYQAIYDAHVYANYYGYNVKATLDTYHIYKYEQTNFISIQTNTDWNNATFFIHDEAINDKQTRNVPIFKIDTKKPGTTLTDKGTLEKIHLTKETKNVPELSGYGNAMCIAYNEEEMQFIRYGTNQDTGRSQRDFFKIDNKGNVLNEIQWDFDNISEILIIPIPEETITVENGNFETILPQQKYEQDTGYFLRNIYCNRSNTIIKNINHTVNNKEYIGGPYKGFINVYEASDVIIKSCTLFSHKYENKSNYDLFLEYVINTKVENVTSNDIEDQNRWGIVGTHYTKNITFEKCTLNRIDAHTGVHNLTINDCTIGIKGITVVGSGNLKISNSTIQSSNYLIELRQDYGSTWDGNIYITDCIYKPKKAQQLIYFKASYDNENNIHDFGYDLCLPNIFIDGLKIDDKNASYNDNSLYMFYNDEQYTGNSDGNIENIYNLPEKIYIKDYTTTSGRSIKLFYKKFYNNLEDIGIKFSVPLSYKKNVQVVYDDGSSIENNAITNKDITIVNDKVEGINTQISINGSEVINSGIRLSESGEYLIQIKYSNYTGQKEEKDIKAIIDKKPPTITGVEDRKIYVNTAKPVVKDENIASIFIRLNDTNIEYYDGIVLKDEGTYNITAMDKAGNTSTIEFYVVDENPDGYIIKDSYIMNVWQKTTVTQFREKLGLDIDYKIKRKDTELKETDIVATGDIVELPLGIDCTIIVAGDINGNGEVTVYDLSMLRNYILKIQEFNEIQSLAADINVDGNEIGVKDYSRMRIEILGIY